MKSILFIWIVKITKWILRLGYPNKFSTKFLDEVNLNFEANDSRGEKYVITCPSYLNYWRAKTFFTKEPDMIEWIDTISPNSILFDIGANIGLYTVYAGKKQNIKKIIAIEPESQNYSLLNKNIYLNHLSGKVIALNAGISNRTQLDTLFLSSFEAGAALHTVGDKLNWKKETFNPSYEQAVFSFKIDDLLKSNPAIFPTHIKIDVDGVEGKIIDGAIKTLMDKRLKEIMIELNTNLPDDKQIIEKLKGFGFQIKGVKHSPLSKDRLWDGVDNYLFSRV